MKDTLPYNNIVAPSLALKKESKKVDYNDQPGQISSKK